MFDLNDPFFRPLWLRIALVALCGGWALWEALSGHPGWALLAGGLGAYCIYGFFLAFDPRAPKDGQDEDDHG